MAKSSAKKLSKRKRQKLANQFTPKTFTEGLLFTIHDDKRVSTLVGQSVYLVLKYVKEGEYKYTLPFSDFVAATCMLLIKTSQRIIGDKKKLEPNLVVLSALTILVQGDLLKGVLGPVLPVLKKNTLSTEVTVSPEGIELTDQGEEFFNNGKEAFDCLLGEKDQEAISEFSSLAIEYMLNVALKFRGS